MKAYVARFKDEEWCTLIHGETRAKAKYNFMRWNPSDCEHGDYIFVRLHRLPGCDDKPFTAENIAAAGFTFSNGEDEGDEWEKDIFINDCRCNMCEAE